MRPLVAIDWGTSSLRGARLGAQGEVLEERASARGILTVAAGGFPAVLQESFGDWLADPATLCLMSGMVGSRQGWREAPYCACPAGFADIAAALAWVEPGRIAIVPGLRCDQAGVPDVMRGEETQVFGALSLQGAQAGLFVLPGTHSKWVTVLAGRVEGFATFMTGEVYALLRQHSILARTMAEADGALDADAFVQGVRHARLTGNLLQAAFSARTLALFDRLGPAAAPSYLSGLLIGEELRSQVPAAGQPVTLIGSAALTQRYALALESLGVPSQAFGAQAGWQGLWAIAAQLQGQP
ncbi:MAG TPA: 2-dehydro-3-deoxygalactonokinase [Ramlibacter sp.]|nr:2-dehydro-3-deoxygalactonokinase [Ramlibacter sp.]